MGWPATEAPGGVCTWTYTMCCAQAGIMQPWFPGPLILAAAVAVLQALVFAGWPLHFVYERRAAPQQMLS